MKSKRGTATNSHPITLKVIPMTVKHWNKFTTLEQENILKAKFYSPKDKTWYKYEIILTDHKTKYEKTKHILKKFNTTNLNKGIKKYHNAIDEFHKITKDFSEGLGGASQNDIDKAFGNTKKDLSFLTGKKSQ